MFSYLYVVTGSIFLSFEFLYLIVPEGIEKGATYLRIDLVFKIFGQVSFMLNNFNPRCTAKFFENFPAISKFFINVVTIFTRLLLIYLYKDCPKTGAHSLRTDL